MDPNRHTDSEYEGRIENWQERFPESRIEHYRSGASGGIYKGYDTLENRIVGIKELKGSKEGVDLEFLQTGEMQIRNIRDMINALGKSQHPGLMRVYGYYEEQRKGLKHPHLVFELIESPSVLDYINQNGSQTEEKVREFLVANGFTLDHLHTSNGQPIFHRDFKPANAIAMPEEGRWPYVLVDLGSVGLGIRETFKGTQKGTFNYVPQMQWAFGKVNKGTENFALIRSALHYAIGPKFEALDLDHLDLKSLQLNYSDALQRVLSTSLTQDESLWYHDFGKLMHDLGYNNQRAPQTREELEAIIGHRGLPVQVKTEQNSSTTSVSVGQDRSSLAPSQQRNLILPETPEFLSANLLKGRAGKEFMEEFEEEIRQRGYENIPAVNSILKYGRMFTRFGLNGVVKGGNSFTGVIASEILRRNGQRMSTRPDIEKSPFLIRNPFEIRYIDVGLALKTGGDSHRENDLPARILVEQLKYRGMSLGTGKLISFNALSLERNPNSHYGLVFNLNDEATQEDILDLNSFKWDYSRKEGLSQAFFGSDLDRYWNSGFVDLADSNGNGRVVSVKTSEAGSPEN